MIVAEKLTRYFNGAAAVKDVSFDVDEGENLVLLGTSGSGKTTTLRMLNRLTEPSSGNVYINGRSIYDQPAETLRRGMGYVLQNNGLFPHYTVAENIAVVPRLLHWSKEQIQERTVALLQKLHLPPEQYLNVYPDQLSGGQQQRVGLARALAANPPILLMDEPFGALDPITRAHIRKEFLALDELKKTTIILVTHDVPEAFELGDKICLMHQGAVMQMGTPADLLFRPANEFVRAFLSSQRLQLELNAIRLRDIWNYVDDNGTAIDADDPAVSWDQSLWYAMEYLSGVNARPFFIATTDENAERRAVSLSVLFSALSQLKQSR